MAIDFPDSPSTNDTYTVNGRTYTWNGEKWLRTKPELTSVVPTLTISSDLTVDTDTLATDSSNSRVGIGTTSPNQTLDVDGALAVRNKMVTGQSTFTQEPWNQTTIALGAYGSIGTQGSHRTSWAWNYERGTDSGWHALGINSYTSAAGIDLGNDGILFRADTTYGASSQPTARMVMTPDGKVGIGTTSPANLLHIKEDSYGLLSLDRTANANVDQQVVLAPTWNGANNTALDFNIGSTIMRLTEAGNVGIGTTSPATKLDLDTGSLGGTSGDTLNAQRWYTEAGSNDTFMEMKVERLSTGTDWTTAGWRLQHQVDSTPMAFVQFNDDATGNDRGLLFGTNNTVRMTINNAGNVGIGTTSPEENLDVTGSNSDVSLLLRSGDVLTGANNGKQIVMGYAGSANYAHNIRTRHNGSAQAGNAIDFYTWNQGVDGSTTYGTKHVMTLDGNGNVGIGNTSPGYKLDVNGALAIGNTSQIFTNWSSGSDIDGLLPGSTFGGVMYTNTSGHFAIGIRNNDTADSFSIVSGGSNSGGYTSNNTFDLLVANFRGDGNGSIAGTWTTSASDERLKTVTGTITEPLTKISALEGFYFTWNDVASELGLPDADVVQVGVSAQSVLGVMPEAVRTAPISQGKAYETEYYTVMYERLVPLLIEGVKAQQTQIDALTAQNAALTTRIEALEAN